MEEVQYVTIRTARNKRKLFYWEYFVFIIFKIKNHIDNWNLNICPVGAEVGNDQVSI